jgi:cell division protein FtsW (lipid II flippase)
VSVDSNPTTDKKAHRQTQRALYASLACLGLALLGVAFLVALGPQATLYVSPALYAPLAAGLILLTTVALLISLWGLRKARWRSWPLLLIALLALVLVLSLLFGL